MTDTVEAIDLSKMESVGIPDAPDAPKDIACTVCGKDISYLYSGRGRKPKYCEEHKPARAASSLGSARSVKGTGAVKQAVTNLENLYNLMGMGLYMAGAKDAASSLAQSVPGLSEANRQYLETDPALVKMLNNAGTTGGRTMFFITNAMTLGPVAVLAYQELTAKREARQAEYEDAQ
jgi:hypothetical protein